MGVILTGSTSWTRWGGEGGREGGREGEVLFALLCAPAHPSLPPSLPLSGPGPPDLPVLHPLALEPAFVPHCHHHL